MITIIQADGVAERRQINAMRARAAEKNADIERAVQAILEDVGREGLPARATPLGAVSVQRWRYIGRSLQHLTPGDRVSWGELRLVVQEARSVPWGGGTLYWWALLRKEKEKAV